MLRRCRFLLKAWVPALVWMMLIFLVSGQQSTPHAADALLDVLLRKGGHFLAYALLAYLTQRALYLQRPRPRPTAAQRALALAVVVFYAVTDEFHQSFVPGRGPGPGDVLIDSAGALAMLLFLACLPTPLLRLLLTWPIRTNASVVDRSLPV